MRIVCSKYLVASALLLSLYINHLFAAGYPPLTYIGIEKGLSNNSVRCIYQDHNGFMWFGTYDGLNRFDGYEFKVFRNKLNDSGSLPHNYIYSIQEDSQNNLWIGTGQGIGIYNPLTSKFLPAYFSSYQTGNKAKITISVNSIKMDAKGNILMGTGGWGLMICFKGKDIATQIPFNGLNVATDYSVQSIKIDNKQRIWLFIPNIGLCLYNSASNKLQLVNNTLKSASSLESDEDGNLWAGTTGGLYKYSVTANTFQKFDNEKLTSNNIATLCFDKQGRLWIGTEGGGVNILNTKTGDCTYLLPGENNNGLTSESVFAIYEDNECRKWMGTLKGGINKIDPQDNQFRLITHNPLNNNSLINNFVSSFYEDENSNLWIGTDGGGMSIWNRKQNSFTNFKYEPDNNHSLSSNLVSCIRKDYLNNIWIATFGGGINKFNKQTGTFEHFRCFNDATREENINAWLLFEDHEQVLWATTFAGGKLYRFNRPQNRFEVFDQKLDDLISLTEDRSGTLWCGNSHQLIKIDRVAKRHIIYEIGKPIRTLFEDSKGNFWIGTEGGGLSLFNRQQGQIVTRYSDANGLCNNSVLNILEDNMGCLWLSTFNGLSRFNPTDKSFKNYYQEDGLQSNQFLFNAALRLKSGELVFGGIKGFNIFYPDSLRVRNYRAPVFITDLRIDNTPVSMDSRYVTKINGDKIETLKIPFNKAVLSFDFAALEFSVPGKISYAYYMEGWDKGWNYTGKLRTANYSHLSEGTYILHIKSTNADGSWNPDEVRLKIIVLPPWYRSWGAYMFYLMMLGSTIYFYLQYRSKQAKLKYEVSLAKLNAEKERAELERERSEREKVQAEYQWEKAERETERVINEKEKEINEKRLSFFTNISHEFRTPLTLIINPIKDLLNRNSPDKTVDSNELNIVYHNARRLLSLVDQLLLFRKADTDVGQMKISKLNFCNLCREVYLAFVQQARTLQIEYTFDCAHENLEIYGDREKLEIILYNLISNALKFTPQGGKVVFSVLETENSVKVAVVDNGCGIPKETGDKLFERFYQVQQKGKPSKSGFGIGLYLVKQFVEHHKGTLSYQSEPGKGTTFFIWLQKGKEHFGEQTILEEAAEETAFLQELVDGQEAMIENKVPKEGRAELEALISENQSLLVVDDDEQLRQYITQVFADKFTVYQAGNGEEGLNLAQQYIPDMIVCDVNMPGINGIDFCKTVKEDAVLCHIPVIILTASTASETKLQGVENGADDYITKPFEKELLKARVASLLKSRNNLQKYFYNEITLQKNPLKISSEYKEFLDRCIAIVERYIDDNDFSIKVLASELGMSHSNLYKKVKSVSGQSINAFVRFIRLRKAAELFINTNYNVNETAAEVGFNDMKYFREQFSKLFGMNPSEYIKKYRNVFGKSFHLNEGGYSDH